MCPSRAREERGRRSRPSLARGRSRMASMPVAREGQDDEAFEPLARRGRDENGVVVRHAREAVRRSVCARRATGA
jgi:hypothetical protein